MLLVTLSAAGGPSLGPSATSALATAGDPSGAPSPAEAGPAVAMAPAPSTGPVRTPPQVQVIADRGSVRITGRVASEAAAASIQRKVEAVYGAKSVDVRLEVDPAVSDQGVEKMADVVTALGTDATGVTVDLAQNQVALQGYVATEEVHADVTLAASEVVPDAEDVVDGIRVVTTPSPTPSVDESTEPMTTAPPEVGTADDGTKVATP